MNHSETLGELAKALAAFQAVAPKVAKDKTAKVPMKSGGQYSYNYADLADVAAAAYPLLAAQGLSFSCCPGRGANGWEVEGMLMHSSGEWSSATLPMHGSTPQEIGSAITYARRYLLGSMTGIVTDADDDGGLAQVAATRAKATPRQAPAKSADDKPAESGELISDPQMRALRATLAEVGLTDRDDILAEVAAIIGHPIDSSKDLTRREASRVIDRLKSLASGPAVPAASVPGGTE